MRHDTKSADHKPKVVHVDDESHAALCGLVTLKRKATGSRNHTNKSVLSDLIRKAVGK